MTITFRATSKDVSPQRKDLNLRDLEDVMVENEAFKRAFTVEDEKEWANLRPWMEPPPLFHPPQ